MRRRDILRLLRREPKAREDGVHRRRVKAAARRTLLGVLELHQETDLLTGDFKCARMPRTKEARVDLSIRVRRAMEELGATYGSRWARSFCERVAWNWTWMEEAMIGRISGVIFFTNP